MQPSHRRASDAKRRAEKPYRAWYKTARWRAIRAAQLAAQPLCWLCLARGIRTPATICNHAKRHEGDPVAFWSGPFNSMCKQCHDSDQQRIEHGGRARRAVDERGWPIDTTHNM